MSRPPKCRWVGCLSDGLVFKPRGIPMRDLDVVFLQLDELEALRQAHLEGKSQEGGAEALGISRSTFGRILESAHQKITTALIQQKAITISGGPIVMDKRRFECKDCGHTWEVSFGTGRPPECPACKSQNFYRTDAGLRQRGACKHGPRPRSRGGRS